jgi:hypothetical protein
MESCFSRNPAVGDMTEWATAIWLFCIGMIIFFHGRLIKAYIVSEMFLGLITTFVIGVWLFGGHAVPFGLGLIGYIVLFVFFTCIPVGLAIRILSQDRGQPNDADGSR